MATQTTVSYIIKLTDKMSPAIKRIKRNLQGLKQHIKNINAQIVAFSNRINSLGAGIAIAGFGMFTNNLVQSASDAEETRQKFGVVFRDIREQADAVALDLQKNYGLSSKASQQLLSDTGDLLSGFGFTGDMALDVSEKVNKLAVDLASFTNYEGGAEGASQALTKALLGERESVKLLGIAILEEDVKARIKQMEAMGQLIGMTDRQKKAYATLSLAEEQSANARGDFARSIDSYANQMRIFKARLDDVKESLGRALLPIWKSAVKWFQSMASWIQENEQLFQSLIKGLVVLAGVIAGVIVAVKVWTAVQTVLNAVMSANPIGIIILAITALVGAIIWAKNHWNELTETFKAQIEIMKLALAGAKDHFTNMWQTAKDAFKLIWLHIKNVGQKITGFFTQMGEAWSYAFQGEWEKASLAMTKPIETEASRQIEELEKQRMLSALKQNLIDKKRQMDMYRHVKMIDKIWNKTSEEMPQGVSDYLGGISPSAPISPDIAGTVGESVVQSGGIKSFNINIQKITGVESLTTSTVKESAEEIGKMISQSIMKAVADVQLT